MAAPAEDTHEDPVALELDREIEALRAQAKALRAQRQIQTTTILSSRTTQAILTRLRASKSSRSASTSPPPPDLNPLQQSLVSQSRAQLARNEECLYRSCAGITTFKVQDPDPRAVDGGAVLGLRVEAFASGRFAAPYYVFLNRPYAGSALLRVHRHTVPPCIPLAALAARYLPTPTSSSSSEAEVLKAREQDLARFARALRREVAHYHNRVALVAGLRKAFGLDDKRGRAKGKGRELVMRDITAADAEAKQIRFEWVDGRIGRAVVDSKGGIQKCVVIGEEGRDRDMERRILGGNRRLEGVAERMGAQR